MKGKSLIIIGMMLCISAGAQDKIVKTGLNFGPLPAVAFDADKGFQAGAILNIYDFGDGSGYPNYNSKTYIEASYFTKGSVLFQLMYDNKSLIPGVRWSSAASLNIDKAMDFYGFGGYQSYYDADRIAVGKGNKKGAQDPTQYIYTPFYRYARTQLLAKTDFIGKISKNFFWEAGYHFSWYKNGPINRESINKGKPDYNIYPDSQSTLYEDYVKWGLISEEEAEGGISSSIRAGLMYDTRDREGAPTHGIWAEAHVAAAPKWLGTTSPYARYSATFRHYVPLTKRPEKLVFAYRLNYEGTIGKSAPWYVLPFITVMGENSDKDGFGGYRTVRGMIRDRVIGLDMASYNVELRWRFVNFALLNQNIAFGLSVFSDGAMVTRNRDMNFKTVISEGLTASELLSELPNYLSYKAYMDKGQTKDTPHITTGAGLRFIMNENFIVAFEYGTPITHFVAKTNPLRDQDGTGASYINIGYLF